MSERFVIQPIGHLETCYPEKFGVPRQPGLAPEARGALRFLPEFRRPEMFRELAGFSHVWLIWVFHQVLTDGWRTMVRPPRLGGNRSVGVFASRSGYRPNHLGLSAVRLESVDEENGCLMVSGVDVVSGTPVVDLKPYLPFADSVPEATSGYSPTNEAPLADWPIRYSDAAATALAEIQRERPEFQAVLEATLRHDPRPGYETDERVHGLRLWRHNVRWRVAADHVWVESMEPVSE